MAMTSVHLRLFCFFFVVGSAHAHPNYGDALAKSILFFEGQRSGWLPKDQRITWRSHSGLSDGSRAHVDLTGGYYDGGDNVKFGFPMAFTATMLSWSALEYGKHMGAQLENTRVAIRWATDYLIKAATVNPGKLYVGVGNPTADHQCWERPEDMDTPRNVYSVSQKKPGSDVAAETAAALAAASMVFRKVDPPYSRLLLNTSEMVMEFAMTYQGAYSDSLGSAVCPFYCSYSSYKDELLWGASWLLRATKKASYFRFLKSLKVNNKTDIFSWDNKLAGARVLLSRQVLLNKDKSFKSFRLQAENFVCKVLPNSPSSKTNYTPGGLIYKLIQANLQYTTSISFLLTTYGKYMMASGHSFRCGDLLVKPTDLTNLAKKQVDYILGENPKKMSYMVGYGKRFPRRIHHRASSLPSLYTHPEAFHCKTGFKSFFPTTKPNPNILTGAVVGGPDINDVFADNRTDYSQSEPTTYINAALVGPLAYLVGTCQ